MGGTGAPTQTRWSYGNGSAPPTTERIILAQAESASGWSLAIKIFGAGAGLAAVLYAIGGGVDYLRYLRAGLPAIEALSLQGNRQILMTGAISVAFSVAFFGIAFVAIYFVAAGFILLLGRIQPPTRAAPTDDEQGGGGTGPRKLTDVVLRRIAGHSKARRVVAAVVGLVLIVVLASLGPEVGIGIGFDVAEAAGITGLLSGMVGLIPGGPDVISDMYTRLSKLSRLRRAAFCLVPVFVCRAAAAVLLPLEMPAAVARLTDGSCVTGLYLSRGGNAVHLVDGKTDQIFSISPIVLASITVGRNERVSRTSISTGSCSGIVT
jgi:hypothetical protein